jgi:hypothetical protein
MILELLPNSVQGRQLLHDRRLTCPAELADAALGILFKGLSGLRTDVALSFTLGKFFFRGCLFGSLPSFRHKDLLTVWPQPAQGLISFTS